MHRMCFFYTLLFCSGISALVYEVSWNRQIGLIFGHTAQCTGIVISIYFLGMSIGYWWAGKTVDQKQTPLRSYALAEIVVGAWSILIPTLLQNLHSPFFQAWGNHSSPSFRIIFRVLAVTVVILPSVVALGYSFPAFAKFIAIQKKQAQKPIIYSYALNTAGAFTGTFLSPVLIYYFGVTGINYLAAGVSIICGLSAFVVSLKIEKFSSSLSSSSSHRVEQSISPFVYWMIVLSGGSILGLEVLYTHLFSLISHNSTYNFTATLCSCLISLSLGSLIVSQIKKRTTQYFVWICAGISLAIPFSLQIFLFLTRGELFAPTNNFILYLLSYFLLNLFVVVFPITIASTILPLCWDHLSSHQGKTIGHITFINTISGAIGSGAATFFMISYFGIRSSFVFLALIYCCTSIVFFLNFYKAKRILIFSPLYIIIFCICIYLPPVDEYKHKNHEKIWHRETIYGPIDVIREKSSNNLKITQNNHYVLGSSLAEVREQRQAHIPLLLHRAPKKIAFLGIGTGMTMKGALQHKTVKHIDAIELIPEVIEAAKFFHPEKNNVFRDPRVHIIVNDARHHLYQSGNKYDVIISDLFVPWHSYTGYLYTKEHYEIANKSLEKNGLFCQWLPLYQLGENEFQMIADSFVSVFPYTSLWRGENNDEYPLMALIGSKKPLIFDPEVIEKKMGKLTARKRVKVKLKKRMISILLPRDRFLEKEYFFSLYVGEWQLKNKKLLNTDEFPRVEFSTPITQNEEKLLRNRKLREYYRKTLNRLPKF